MRSPIRIPVGADRFWQNRARAEVRMAIERGVLPSLKSGEYACVDCGGVACQYEHRDYGRPLDVEPVCRLCNRLRGTAKWPTAADYQFAKLPSVEAA